jgi:dolichyl-phosphate-mannose-protein mannosyltransferase
MFARHHLRQLATRLIRTHWAIAGVLVLAVAVRAAVAIAYRPAIFFGDSWAYLDLAYNGRPVGLAPDRPSGYPLLIDLLSVAGRSLATITTAQHLAGLLAGVLAYALLVKLGLPRLLAAGAAAVVLLDGYAIALEQQIMAESFFALALVASMYLAVGKSRGPAALAASGLLLAGAATIRTVALFAIPVWIVYLLWAHGRNRAVAAGLTALLVTLLAYSSIHAANTGRFGLGQADGWFLYGRVGQFADCGKAGIPPDARALCNRTDRDRREGAAFHVWNADGPARRVFGGMSRDPDEQARSNAALRGFALAIVRDRPLRYARAVSSDFLRYFYPGRMSRGNSDLALTLPESGRIVRSNELIRDRYFPAYEPQVHEPAALVRSYQQRLHTPRWLMGVLALAALLALAAAAIVRGRVPMLHSRETFLLTGAALAMLLGSAATSEFVLRYLIPAVPLILGGGLAGCADLAELVRSRERAQVSVRRALHARA